MESLVSLKEARALVNGSIKQKEKNSIKIKELYKSICNSIRKAANKGEIGVIVDVIKDYDIRTILTHDGFELFRTNKNTTWIFWGK